MRLLSKKTMYAQLEFIHDVDDAKLEIMSSKVWCDLEAPIVAVPLQYSLKLQDNLTNGFLMFTRGAAYIFKSKFIGQPELVSKFSLLNVRRLSLRPQNLVFEFINNSTITLKTDDVAPIARAMLTVLYEATYGVTKYINMPIVQKDISFPDITITERPKDALKWRALFLAHYYDIKGEQLFTLDYFDKWEDKQKPTMMLGPSLHPGNFASAYGHAIAWETKIETVVFQSFAPTKYAYFIQALLQNSMTIKRIIYTDYKPKKLPIFNFRVQNTEVKKWCFLRCCADVILLWADETRNLPGNISSVSILNCNFTPEQFTKFANSVQSSHVLNEVHTFDFAKFNIINSFPYQEITRFCSIATHLESISFRSVDADGTRIFRAICKSHSPIKIIHLNHLQFKSNFKQDEVVLPTTVIHLDVSNSAFTPSSLTSLLQFITLNQQPIPFIFEASSLAIKPECYQALSELHFDQCMPNISEFDWSNNNCPSEQARFLFGFIFTQNRLRLLSLNGITTDNPTTFMQYIIELAQPLNLAGLDIADTAGKFPPQLFAQFIQALANVKSLKRLNVKNSESGDQGLAALDLVIKSATGLNEVVADGFKPTNPSAICAIWNDIASLPEIKSVDLPSEDMRNLGMQMHRLDQQTLKAFSTLKALPRPSTVEQRDEAMLIQIRANQQPDCSSAIFGKAATIELDKNYEERIEEQKELNDE